MFGNCHVKIKYDKKNQLPTAFLQFEVWVTISLQSPCLKIPSLTWAFFPAQKRTQDAEAALQYNNAPVLHGRVLRIERAKARSKQASLDFLRCSFSEWAFNQKKPESICG